jgi:hypothetical protein
MPALPNWHVWKFSKLNNCHARTAYRHKNLNTSEWQSFFKDNQTPPQEELCLLKASLSKKDWNKKNYDKGDYGFFLSVSKEFQKEASRYYKKTNKSKESAYGFLYKDIINECSWMHPKIKRFGILHGGNRGVFRYKYEGAWLDTPLHFSSWLLLRRKQKQHKALLANKRNRLKDNARKRQRWATNQEYRKRANEMQKVRRKDNYKHKEYMRNYRAMRRLDYGIRLKQNARSRFWKVMQGIKKDTVTDSFNLFIGCSAAFLKRYIEKQFAPTMSWSNYGAVWEVDHKIPLKNFDLKNQDQAKAAFHFSNLQPATTSYNRSKQARWSDV